MDQSLSNSCSIQICNLRIINDDDIFIVVLCRIGGEIKGAGDHKAVIHNDHLIMQESGIAILADRHFCTEKRIAVQQPSVSLPTFS